MNAELVLRVNHVLQAEDKVLPELVPIREILASAPENRVLMTQEAPRASKPGAFPIALNLHHVPHAVVVMKETLNVGFVRIAKGLVQLRTSLGFFVGKRTLKVHLVETRERGGAPPAHGVGGVVACDRDFVDVLFGLK
jgi:hypothetical protein